MKIIFTASEVIGLIFLAFLALVGLIVVIVMLYERIASKIKNRESE